MREGGVIDKQYVGVFLLIEKADESDDGGM